MIRRLFTGLGLGLSALPLLVLGLAAPASAHVTVEPEQAVRGGYATLTFRVPNEQTTVTTTRLTVVFPADTPVPSVTVRATPGWTPKVSTVRLAKPVTVAGTQYTEAVSTVEWTAAAGAAIPPNGYQLFEVHAGPLPNTNRLLLKALQTYSDGQVVRWIQPPSSDSATDHPAPVLQLVKGAPTSEHEHGSSAVAVAEARPATGGGIALAVAVGALVIAIAALLLALLERLRRS